MAYADIKNRLVSEINQVFSRIRKQILGSNNEKLDLLMDTFSALEPEKKSMVLVGGVASVLVLVVFVVILYGTQVSSLQSDLDDSFQSLKDLKELSVEYKQAENSINSIFSLVERKTRNLKYKPFFEKKAQEVGVSLENLDDKILNLPPENPLSERLNEVNVSFRLSKVSLPRLVKFLIEVERSDKFLRVRDLKIRERFGTKEYFDASVVFRGYGMM
jgi:hypothetical protein